MAATWASPRRTTAPASPGGAPRSTWRPRTSCTRPSRALESPLPRVMPSMTPPPRRTHRSAARDLAPRRVRVEAGLAWQAEHPVTENVALDVVGAAGDGGRRRRHEGDHWIGLA